MNRRALVTGAHGFIGRHVSRVLTSEGWHVIGIGRGSWSKQEQLEWGVAEWHEADVTLESLAHHAVQPEVIVHCAGSGSVGFSLDHPYEDFQQTVTTTLEVLEFARTRAPQAHIVYPSSAGVYGVVRELPIVEGAPLSPASPYGVHKLVAEKLCVSYARQYSLPVAIVRLFSVYGPGLRKQLLWDAAQKIAAGTNSFFGTGKELRDWLHVDDAARLLETAAQHASTACPVINGGTGTGASVREVLETLFACSGHNDPPQFSGIIRDGDPPGYVADITLAQAWGWQPTKDWQDGVREYADWIKNGGK